MHKKYFLLLFMIMASMLSAPPKSKGMTYSDECKYLELKEDLDKFITLEVAGNKLDDKKFMLFLRNNEDTIRDLVTRMNTLTNTYPDNKKLSTFTSSRNHLQDLLNTIED